MSRGLYCQGGRQLQVCQVRPGAASTHSLLCAGRPGHLRRQQGAGNLNEDSANCAYELTFWRRASCFVYVVLIRRLVPKREAPKYLGALCETAGQLPYLCPGGHGACSPGGPHHLRLLRSAVGGVEPYFPEGKALLKHYLTTSPLVVAGIAWLPLGIYDGQRLNVPAAHRAPCPPPSPHQKTALLHLFRTFSMILKLILGSRPLEIR